MAALFAYPLGVLPGIPMYLMFRRLGWLKLWQTALAALIVGAFEGLVFCLVIGSSTEQAPTLRESFYAVGMFSAAALIVGVTFWILAIGQFGRITRFSV